MVMRTPQWPSKDDVFPVQVVGQQEPQQITEEYLAEIIEARLEQIFEKLRDELEQVDALSLPGGVVLTGGTAALPGIKELAEDVLDVNVRVYVPQEMNLRDPKFTGVLGLTPVYRTATGGLTGLLRTPLQAIISRNSPLMMNRKVMFLLMNGVRGRFGRSNHGNGRTNPSVRQRQSNRGKKASQRLAPCSTGGGRNYLSSLNGQWTNENGG